MLCCATQESCNSSAVACWSQWLLLGETGAASGLSVLETAFAWHSLVPWEGRRAKGWALLPWLLLLSAWEALQSAPTCGSFVQQRRCPSTWSPRLPSALVSSCAAGALGALLRDARGWVSHAAGWAQELGTEPCTPLRQGNPAQPGPTAASGHAAPGSRLGRVRGSERATGEKARTGARQLLGGVCMVQAARAAWEQAPGEGPQRSASTPRLITLWGTASPRGPILGCVELSCCCRVGLLLHWCSGMPGQWEAGATPCGDMGSSGRASPAASCPPERPPVPWPVNSRFFCLV